MTEWFTPESASEQLLFSTIRIWNPPSVGTGFIFTHGDERGHFRQMIITNKHVIVGKEGRLVFHVGEGVWPQDRPTGELYELEIDNFSGRWIPHPSADVDLCGMYIGGYIDAARASGKNLFYRALDKSIIWSDDRLRELNAVEEVLMFGYPSGLWDETNNLPIVRRGITSTPPAINYSGKSEMVIDIAAFPGSSGSPIAIAQESSIDKRGNLSLKQRIILLGVLYAGPTFTNEGEIKVKNIPTAMTPVPVIETMMNIGYIIKAKEILSLVGYMEGYRKTIQEGGKASLPPRIFPT